MALCLASAPLQWLVMNDIFSSQPCQTPQWVSKMQRWKPTETVWYQMDLLENFSNESCAEMIKQNWWEWWIWKRAQRLGDRRGAVMGKQQRDWVVVMGEHNEYKEGFVPTLNTRQQETWARSARLNFTLAAGICVRGNASNTYEPTHTAEVAKMLRTVKGQTGDFGSVLHELLTRLGKQVQLVECDVMLMGQHDWHLSCRWPGLSDTNLSFSWYCNELQKDKDWGY